MNERRKFLKIEWSENNDWQFEEVSPHSDKKCLWVCSKCHHEWSSTMHNRTVGKGCPACANRVATPNNCLAKWDISKELISDVDPNEIVEGSNKKLKWRCSKCGHEWMARVVDRVNGRGCKVCAGQAASSNKNITIDNPWYLIEWNYDKNGLPKNYLIKSNKKVWWVCSDCGWEWEATISGRAKGNGNCPKCSGLICSEKNSVYSDLFLIEYWNDEADPKLVYRRSGLNFRWMCQECNHTWIMSPHRFSSYRGCPQCSTGSKVSKIAKEWLDSVAPNSTREKEIGTKFGIIKVDGFDDQTNTIYEFLGDYWHGNPTIYKPEDKNKTNNIKFGKLHKKTLKRLKALEEDGYNVICIWESEYKRGKKASD